jgi:ATP-dependent Lhr-like helicase
MARAAGASVILVNGRLAAFFRRRNPSIRVFLPEEEPERSQIARHLAKKLAEVAIRFQERRSGLLITTINEEPAAGHFIGRLLEESGFILTAAGYQMRRITSSVYAVAAGESADDGDDGTDSDA